MCLSGSDLIKPSCFLCDQPNESIPVRCEPFLAGNVHHICSTDPHVSVLFLQQAIEDLQCEEEKVNLLTKEKAKLKLQAEDVSRSAGHCALGHGQIKKSHRSA